MEYSTIADLKWTLVVAIDVDEVNALATEELKMIIFIAALISIFAYDKWETGYRIKDNDIFQLIKKVVFHKFKEKLYNSIKKQQKVFIS